MPKEEWGVKRACTSCATRFYDLNNDPTICPACGAEIDIAMFSMSKAKLAAASAKKEALIEDAEVLLDEAAAVLDDDDVNNVDLGDDVLDDDDDNDTATLEEIADVPSEEDDS